MERRDNFVMTRSRRIAIVCQPWDNVTSQGENSIVTVSYQLARCLARDWHVTIYGRRGSGQKRWEIDDETVEFKRFKVHLKPQAQIETLLSILACYKKFRINYMFSIWYHLCYALRVAISIRMSKYDVIYVHNFLQFASLLKLINPTATICLHMHCEWLRQFATPTNERRLHKIDLVIGVSDYITQGTRARFPAIAERCHTVYNGVEISRFSPSPNVPVQSGRRLLFVARVSPEKGVHILIRAFKKFLPRPIRS